MERLIDHCVFRTTKVGLQKKPGHLRLTELRFPDFIPATQKRLHELDAVLFAATKGTAKEKRRKETHYYCQPCNVELCAVSGGLNEFEARG